MIYLLTVPKDDTGLGTAAIVVTIVASVFFAVLLMALVAWYYSRLREESRLKSLAEDTYNKSSKYYAYPGTYNTNYRSGTHPCCLIVFMGFFLPKTGMRETEENFMLRLSTKARWLHAKWLWATSVTIHPLIFEFERFCFQPLMENFQSWCCL